MELLASEVASRLVAVLLRPATLVACVVVSLTLTTGLAGRVSLLIEDVRSSRSKRSQSPSTPPERPKAHASGGI